MTGAGELFTAFVDFRKAFDVTDRQLMYCVLCKNGINGALLDLVKQMYTNTTNVLHLNNQFSEEFHSEIGVKQGDNFFTSLLCPVYRWST